MTLSYLLLALGIAVLMNLGSRWARIGGQALAAIALFFNAWSIWLAAQDGTFAAAGAAGRGGQVLALEAMGVVGAGALLALLWWLPRQWRAAEPVRAGNDGRGWGQVSRLLHWGSAVLMLSALPLGLFVVVLPDGELRAGFLDGHVGVGLAIFALLLARLGWQAASPGPAAPNALARLNKAALYLLLAALPLTGLALAANTGAPVLGVTLPTVSLPARAAHLWLSALFALAFAAHAGAVLWHHFGLKDRALIRRMLR